MVERRYGDRQRFRVFASPDHGSGHGVQIRVRPLFHQECREDQQGRDGQGGTRRKSARRVDARDLAGDANAILHRFADPHDRFAFASGLCREARSRLRQAGQHGLQQPLHARGGYPQLAHQGCQEPGLLRRRQRQDRYGHVLSDTASGCRSSSNRTRGRGRCCTTPSGVC